jgi:hypothetical protein
MNGTGLGVGMQWNLLRNQFGPPKAHVDHLAETLTVHYI